MKRIRYSKYVPDPAGEMSMEDLLSALSDYLLQSGFQSDMWYEMPEGEQTLDDLRRAIEQALMDGDQFDEDMRERMQEMAMDGQLDELIEKLIERMQQEDYISIDQPPDPSRPSGAGGQIGENQPQAKFEITDKSLDFLGFKSLRNLLGSLGKSSFGRHDTRDLATGIEASGASRTYEFGDTLNLDITATLSSAIQREGLALPLNIEYSRPASAPVRVSILLRHGAHARLLALDDSLRRRPLHSGEKSCHGALAPDPHAVSRRLALARSLPRLRRRNPALATRPRQGRPLLHQHARRPAPGATNSAAPKKRHEADRHDH